ncbi:histidine phosphatase family protein [Dyadobacter sp. NIV53]|uniref:SixA phosphatase family protein n=1 Tax=Dyadobacter sp. NIV53 TaxID=2861765 RepID=UPI001C881A26|nr:histidine phosphatase family protein [Dyadobacter sp. NIV53]
MKKILILVRHATAEDQSFKIKDFDRQLVDKGLSEATLMGKWLYGKNINPDHFITSAAPRAYKTAEVVADQMYFDVANIVATQDLYDGGPQAYLSAVNKNPEESRWLILFGHNPDITYFAEYLSGSHIGSMKKCGIAIIEFENQKWEEISGKSGNLVYYITPKEVREAS